MTSYIHTFIGYIPENIPEGAMWISRSGEIFYKQDNENQLWFFAKATNKWHILHLIASHIEMDQQAIRLPLKTVPTLPRKWRPENNIARQNIRESDAPGIAAFSPPPPITPAPAFMVKPALRADGLDVIATDSRKFVWGAKC